MKRQHAEVGVKYWDNQDFIDLQGEPLRALDGFFAQYGPCIVQGCEVTKASASTFDVTPGLVVLEGADHAGDEVTMVVPFGGVKGVSMPLCLTLDHTVRERVYGDGKVKPIAFDYYAKPSTVAPTDGTPFFEIKETGTARFVDVIQDPQHRFATDQQQAQWSAKETPEGAQTKAEAALRNAKAYTDQKEGVIRSDMATADTDTLRSAKSYADTVVTALVDGSPEALNTLKELAAALGNDPNFATTVLQKIGEKLDYGEFTGDLNVVNTSKMYRLLSGCTNTPAGSSQGCFLLHTNWDAGAAQQMYFVYSTADIYIRNKVNGAWKLWQKVWNAGNFNPDNYLPLSGGKTITGDFQFQDGIAVRDAAGKSVVGLLNIAGDGVCVAVGNGVKKTRIVTPDDTPVYRNDSKGSYKIWDSGNFNPDNYLPLSGGSVTGGLGVSGYLTAGVLQVKASLYPTVSFVKTNDNSESLLIVAGNNLYYRPIASDTTNKLVYHSGNFNPDDYLPLSGNKTITGNLTVANGFTSGIMKCQTGAYPQLQFEQTNTGITSILFINPGNALMYRPNGAKPSEDYTVYHSGNFNPNSKLDYSEFGGDLNTVSTSGIYRLLSGCTNTPNSGSSQGAHIIHTNWDTNAAHQLYFEYYGSMFYRYKHGGEWSDWKRVWTQFEFNPDSKFNNLENVNDSDNVVGNGYTITETGSSFSGPFLKWGRKDYMVEFFTGNNINDIRIRNMFNGVWGDSVKMYHSGNLGNASTSQAGLMSAADKSKLDGVAANANNYSHPASHPATMITEDATHRFTSDAEKAVWNAKAGTAVATPSAAGLMPAADKQKVDNLPGALAAGRVLSDGSLYDKCGTRFNEGSVSKLATGKYRVRHNIGHSGYFISTTVISPNSGTWMGFSCILDKQPYYFDIGIVDIGGLFANCGFEFVLVGRS